MDDPPECKRYVALLAGGPLTEVESFPFAEDERTAITEIPSNKLRLSVDSPPVQSFLEAAERAAAVFKCLEELERQKPALRTTHSTASKLRKQVPALRQTLEEMDSNFHELLLLCFLHPIFHSGNSAVTKGDESSKKTPEETKAAVLGRIDAERARRELAEDFIGRFARGLVALDAATEMAGAVLSRPEYKPTQGRKAVPWRVQYATEIAWVFWLRLGTEPTATRKSAVIDESVFESVLRICLRAVGDKTMDVHRPAVDALSRIKERNTSEK